MRQRIEMNGSISGLNASAAVQVQVCVDGDGRQAPTYVGIKLRSPYQLDGMSPGEARDLGSVLLKAADEAEDMSRAAERKANTP